MSRESITFCFPYRGVGGVPIQFARLAKELVRRGQEVFAVDYPDGCLARSLDDSRIGLIRYDDRAAVPLPPKTCAIFQAMTPWSIFPSLRMDPATSVLFWGCHPFNLIPTVPGLRHLIHRGPGIGRPVLRWALPGYWRAAREFAHLLAERFGIVFMDEGNLTNTQRYLHVALGGTELLPIPVPVPEREVLRPEPMPQHLRLAWVGRVVDFKYHILRRALLELDRAAPILRCNIQVAIVGDGDHLALLQRDARELTAVAVVFRGRLPPSEITAFLRDDVDVLLAMGTAAIEGAALGIPTVLLDFSYRPVDQNYRFGWLHEASGYSLGALIGPEHGGGRDSMLRLLSEVQSCFPQLSLAARMYALRNHSIGTVCTRLQTLALRTRCRWEHLQAAGVLRRGWLYRVHKRVLRRST